MSDIPSKALDIFPPAVILLMLISGTVFVLLSPFRFILSESIRNPFSNANPTDILASFAVIAICSFATGIILFIIDQHILGEHGLNHHVGLFLRREKEQPKPERRDYIEDMRFYRWLTQEGFAGFYDQFVRVDYIIRGFLLGFQITFILNFFSLLFSPIFYPSLFIRLLILFAISQFFWFFYLYEKKIWKIERNKWIAPLREEYGHQAPKQS
jgi:hypothetical protein